MQDSDFVQFVESPRSPFRRSRTSRRLSPVDRESLSDKKCGSVAGSLSAVKNQISTEGLLDHAQMSSKRAPSPAVLIKKTKHHETTMKKAGLNKEAALIELAFFPGYFSHHVTPLPHGLNTLRHLCMITRAQSQLMHKNKFLRYWEEQFYSKPSQNILNDTFWWFFLHYYQSDQRVQNLLFARIAENYVLLLTRKTPNHHHDTFFQLYPDILIQTVYSAYVHCFPNSWNSFDEKFKSELCDIMYSWFTGTKRMPEKWKEWDLRSLEPKDLMKYATDKQGYTLFKSFNVGQLIDDARKGEKEKTKAKQERDTTENERITGGYKIKKSNLKQGALPLLGPQYEQSVLDISCSSPLVVYFLHAQGLLTQAGYSCLLQHTYISKLTSGDCCTYSEILKKLTENDRMIEQEFQRNYYILKRHMKKHSEERHRLSIEHEKFKTLLHSRRHEVARLSNILVFNIMATHSERSRKEKISHAIKDSLITLT